MKKLVLLLLLTTFSKAFCQNYPIPTGHDTTNTGRYIQRTMHLLASATPEKRNTVKILVYGQSISEQKWWLEVKRDLIERFPNANIIMENRSIGGFASSLLAKTVEMDVSSFYPDLVLFHVYGDNKNYELILRTIRSRTAAEVAIQTDHYNKDDKWSNTMSYELLPALADKYKCELIKIRDGWKNYLAENKYEPSKLLSDGVHLNAHGVFLMAELIKPYLHYKPQYNPNEFKLVGTYVVGKDVFVKGGKLILPFDGNKVDIIASETAKSTKSSYVLVDKKKPSSYAGTYFMTRPYGKNSYGWPWQLPAMIHIEHEVPWLVEEWTCRFSNLTAPYNDFSFSISGSKTGNDGTGAASQDFISNSKRVIIKKGDANQGGDWHLKRSYEVLKSKVNESDEIKWKTYTISADKILLNPGKEVTLFQGIPNGKHLLQISGVEGKSIQEIKVFKPFIQE